MCMCTHHPKFISAFIYTQADVHLAQIHVKAVQNRKARKERERRRRKVLVDQINTNSSSEQSRREKLMLEKLMKNSSEERRIGEELWRTRQYKAIVRDNRAFRDKQYQEQRKIAHEENLERDRVAFEAEKEAHEHQLKLEVQRYEEIRAERKRIVHDRNTEYCRSLVVNLLGLVHKTAAYRELSDQALVPSSMWRDWTALFVNSRPLTSVTGKGYDSGTGDNTDVTARSGDNPTGLEIDSDDEGVASSSPASNDSSVASRSLPIFNNISNGREGNAADDDYDGYQEVDLTSVTDIDRAVTEAMMVIEDAEASADNAVFLDALAFDKYLQGIDQWSFQPPTPPSSSLSEASSLVYNDGRENMAATLMKLPHGIPNLRMPVETVHEEKSQGVDNYASHRNPVTSVGTAPKDTVEAENCTSEFSNAVLGAMVQNIINVASGELQPEQLPEIPSFPIGVCLLGKPFSGKKTQADYLAEAHNLVPLYVDEILAEALRGLEKEDKKERLERKDNKREKGKKKKKSSAREKRSNKLDLANKAKKILGRGGVVSDEIYVGLIVEAIKAIKNPAVGKSNDDSTEGVNVYDDNENNDNSNNSNSDGRDHNGRVSFAPGVSGGNDSDEGGEGRRGEESLPAGGWVLMGFPETLNQAKLLERELSGFVLPKQKPAGPPKLTKDRKKRVKSRIAPPPSSGDGSAISGDADVNAATAAGAVFASGIDLVLCLEVNDNETLSRRALGRRIDPETGRHYHIDSNPPDEDVVVKERLVPLPGADDVQAKLPEQFSTYEEEEQGIKEWFGLFQTLRSVDAGEDADDISELITDYVRDVMQKQEEEKERKATEAEAALLAEEEKERERHAKQLGHPKPSGAVRVDSVLAALDDGDADASSSAATADNPPTHSVDLTDFSSLSNLAGFYDVPLAQLLADKWIRIESEFTRQIKSNLQALRKAQRVNMLHFSVVRKNYFRFLKRADERQETVNDFQSKYNQIHPDFRRDPQVKEELHQRADELGDELWELVEKRKAESEEVLQMIKEDGWVETRTQLQVSLYNQMIQMELDRYIMSIRLAQDYFAVLKGKVVLHEAEAETGLLNLPSHSFGDDNGERGGRGEKGKKSKAKKGKGKRSDRGNDSNDTRSSFRANSNGSSKDADAGSGTLDADSSYDRVFEALDVLVSSLEFCQDKMVLPSKALEDMNKDDTFGSPGTVTDGKGKRDRKANKKERASKRQAGAAAVAEEEVDENSVLPVISFKTPADQHIDAQLREIVESENALLVARVRRIFRNAAADVHALHRYYHTTFINKLEEWLTLRIQGENGSIESFVFVVKAAIEEETPLHYQLRLEGENIFVDKDMICQPLPRLPRTGPFQPLHMQVPVSASSSSSTTPSVSLPNNRFQCTPAQLSHLCRNLSRVAVGADLIRTEDLASLFVRMARASTRGAPDESLPSGWMDKLTFRSQLSSPRGSVPGNTQQMNVTDNRLFHRLAMCFDLDKTGNIDWREVISTLALPAGVSSPSHSQLSQMWARFCDNDTDGDHMLTLTQFLGTVFWFEDEEEMDKDDTDTTLAITALKTVLFQLFSETYQVDLSSCASGDGSDGPDGSAGATQMVDLCDFRAFLLYLCYTDENMHGLDKATSVYNAAHSSPVASASSSAPASHLANRFFKRASSHRLSQFIKKDISHTFI